MMQASEMHSSADKRENILSILINVTKNAEHLWVCVFVLIR